jgi:hypothetical protein
MTSPPSEAMTIHTRLMTCTLEMESARAFWALPIDAHTSAQNAFDRYVFGNRSLSRVAVLLQTLRGRFAAFPEALTALHTHGPKIPADGRRLICHWHLQLSDPLYRAFTGALLVERAERAHPDISKNTVIDWVTDQVGERWNISTRVLFAGKLLSTALSAGLLRSNRDPRVIMTPRVEDSSLEYMLYLLRYTQFKGTLLDNPYFASVGLSKDLLEPRLRRLPHISFQRQGTLIDLAWAFPSLSAWADAQWGSLDGETHRTQGLV